MFVGVIGKQEKLKQGVKMRNQRGIVKRKCSESPRDGIGRMIVIGDTSGVDQVEGRGEQQRRADKTTDHLRSHAGGARMTVSLPMKTVLIKCHSKKTGHKRLLRIAGKSE
jgi:hypothetical protein